MKKIFGILFFFLFLLQFNLSAQWVNVSNGIGNKQVYSLTSSGTNLFAGTFNYGLYISSDYGSNWSMAGISLNNRIVFSQVMFTNYLYAATDIGIWRTSNNGAYWSLIALNNNTVYCIAANQTRIFAGTHVSGLFYSSGGSSWFISSLNIVNVKSLAVNGNFILAGGGANQGVFVSANNGNNWSSTSLNNKSIYSLALNGNNAYAGSGSGVYYSADSGYTWAQSSLNNDLVYSLAVYGNYVFAGTELNGVYLSSNNGLNWTQINDGMGNFSIFSLYIMDSYIFAGASVNSVYRRPLGELVGISPNVKLPGKFSLTQNYPNPFNPCTKIKFDVPAEGKWQKADVKLVIYNILGKEITTLANQQLSPGTYEVDWDASSYPSGVYFYKLAADKFTDTKKMILIK